MSSWLEQYSLKCQGKQGSGYSFRVQGSGFRGQNCHYNLNPEPCTLYPEKGSVLIAVLWALFFLTTLAGAIRAYVLPQLSIAERLSDRHRTHYLAKAGVKRAFMEVAKDFTESYDGLNDSWSFNDDVFKDNELGEGSYSIEQVIYGQEGEEATSYGLIDEERKININKAPFATLKSLFEIIGGTTSQQADDIAESILDWVDKDDEPRQYGAESGYYQTQDPSYTCKNNDFQVLEELLLVKEMTQEIFSNVKNSISIYSSGQVNINTADSQVLQSLQMNGSLTEKILHFRRGNDGQQFTEDDNFFESVGAITSTLSASEALTVDEVTELTNAVNTGQLTVSSQNFLGRSYGRLKDREVFNRIVFVFDRNKKMKYWKED